MAMRRVGVMGEYNAENYKAYVEMIQAEYGGDGIMPASSEFWVAWNEAMDAGEAVQRVLQNPMMADDYNAETGECDGVPYWERNAD